MIACQRDQIGERKLPKLLQKFEDLRYNEILNIRTDKKLVLDLKFIESPLEFLNVILEEPDKDKVKNSQIYTKNCGRLFNLEDDKVTLEERASRSLESSSEVEDPRALKQVV